MLPPSASPVPPVFGAGNTRVSVARVAVGERHELLDLVLRVLGRPGAQMALVLRHLRGEDAKRQHAGRHHGKNAERNHRFKQGEAALIGCHCRTQTLSRAGDHHDLMRGVIVTVVPYTADPSVT